MKVFAHSRAEAKEVRRRIKKPYFIVKGYVVRCWLLASGYSLLILKGSHGKDYFCKVPSYGPPNWDSGENTSDHFGGVNTSKLLIKAHEGERQAVMVDTKLVEDRGAEVADGDFIFNDIIGVVVRFAESGSALDSTSSHPGGETFRVVIAAIVVAGKLALAIGGAAEFTSKDDEGVIE